MYKIQLHNEPSAFCTQDGRKYWNGDIRLFQVKEGELAAVRQLHTGKKSEGGHYSSQRKFLLGSVIPVKVSELLDLTAVPTAHVFFGCYTQELPRGWTPEGTGLDERLAPLMAYGWRKKRCVGMVIVDPVHILSIFTGYKDVPPAKNGYLWIMVSATAHTLRHKQTWVLVQLGEDGNIHKRHCVPCVTKGEFPPSPIFNCTTGTESVGNETDEFIDLDVEGNPIKS